VTKNDCGNLELQLCICSPGLKSFKSLINDKFLEESQPMPMHLSVPNYARLLKILIVPTALVAASLDLVAPNRCSAAFIGLGQAGKYTLFDVSNSQFQFNNSTVGGDIALGPGTTYNISGGTEAITGAVYYDQSNATAPSGFSSGVPTGGIHSAILAQAVADARAADASAASLTANLVVSGNQITNSTGTITGHAGENVIDLTQVNMTNGSVLIDGTATETFIFRVSGQFSVGNSTIRVTGGAMPEHVLWYFPNTSTIKSSNGSFDGTILALHSPVQFDNTPTGLGPIRGAVIATDDVNNNQNWVFSTVSGFDIVDIDGHSFVPVPEPGSMFLAGIGGAGAFLMVRRRRGRKS
jgi:choice-of-anchor A domain-containing protein